MYYRSKKIRRLGRQLMITTKVYNVGGHEFTVKVHLMDQPDKNIYQGILKSGFKRTLMRVPPILLPGDSIGMLYTDCVCRPV